MALKFTNVSLKYIEAGILDGSHIRKLLYDDNFYAILSKKHKIAWNAFRNICKKFLGNHRYNYESDV